MNKTATTATTASPSAASTTRRTDPRTSARTAATRLTAALAAGSVLLMACGGGDDSAEETTPPTEAATTTVESTTTVAERTTTASTTSTTLPVVARQPLTGAPLESEDEILDRAALAVKIDNHPAARQNHTGLAVADIVFEEIVEGQLTRFLAVFHTNDSDPVGPVRSGRSQDVALLTPFDFPLFAWSGGNPGVTRLIRDSQVVDLNATRTPGYYRGPGSGPHDLYSDTETLWALTPEDHPGAPPRQFDYLRAEESFAGDEIAGFTASIGQIAVQWDWDAESATWLRSQAGDPHVDKTHGRIGATNVVVMVVEYGRSTIDAASPEARTVGEGPAYVFSDGQVVEGRWARLAETAPIAFFDGEGEPLALSPGNTWIELASAIDSGDPDNPDVDLSLIPES